MLEVRVASAVFESVMIEVLVDGERCCRVGWSLVADCWSQTTAARPVSGHNSTSTTSLSAAIIFFPLMSMARSHSLLCCFVTSC